jgi:hypothetical protein
MRPQHLLLVIACAILCLSASCSAPWTQETVDTLATVIDRMSKDGAVTPEQAAALQQAVDAAARGTSWSDVLETLGTMLGSVLLAVLGVQRVRGQAARLDSQSIAALRAMLATPKA